MDIYLFAAQLLGLVMFLVDVEEASQMLVKMLQERRRQKKKLNNWEQLRMTVNQNYSYEGESGRARKDYSSTVRY